MNYTRLNSDLVDLIELRNQLAKLNFSDEAYDDLEDEIHEFEDTFNEKYGEKLEDILGHIHENICPEVEVLLPSAYLAKEYYVSEKDENIYEFGPDAGILVETILEDSKGRTFDARIIMVPNPCRIAIIINGKVKTLWSADKPEDFFF